MTDIHGGTLVTITGENFSDDALDNPVKIGDSYCYVVTTSATVITCRQDFKVRDVDEAILIVFLKTSEEAQCDDALCRFTYVEPSSEVLDITTAYNTGSLTQQVFVEGTGLSDDLELLIDGYRQTLVSVTDTRAIFDINEMDSFESSDILVYTSEGFPSGSDIVHTVSLVPSITQIYPASGTAGGTWITVYGTGFGS